MTKAKLTLRGPEPNRWKWEEAGVIFVVSHGAVQGSEAGVAPSIREMVQEFDLPLDVIRQQKPRVSESIGQCIDKSRSGNSLNVAVLKNEINEQRRTSNELRPGLVILVDPNQFDPFQGTDEHTWTFGKQELGYYGESHPDGVCVLRYYHREAVRHELAHMLGLTQHCTNASCAMHYGCRVAQFCAECDKKLRRICFIEQL